MYRPHFDLSIHIIGKLGFFQLLAILNNSFMKEGTQIPLKKSTFNSARYISRVVLLGILDFFEGVVLLFSIVATATMENAQGFQFVQICTKICNFLFQLLS